MGDTVLQPSWFDSKPRPALKSKSAYNQCKNCKTRFAKLQMGNTSLKHHCRVCGEMFCKACTVKQVLPAHLWKHTGQPEQQSTCCYGCYEEALNKRAQTEKRDSLAIQVNKEVLDGGKINVFLPTMQHDATKCAQCRSVLESKKPTQQLINCTPASVDSSGGVITARNNCLLCGRLFCKNCIHKSQFKPLPKEFKNVSVYGGYGICGTCKFQAPGSVFKASPRTLEIKTPTALITPSANASNSNNTNSRNLLPTPTNNLPLPTPTPTNSNNIDERGEGGGGGREHRQSVISGMPLPFSDSSSNSNNMEGMNTRYSQPFGYGVTLQQLKKATRCVVHGCAERRYDGGYCLAHQSIRPEGPASTVVFHTQPVQTPTTAQKGPTAEELMLLDILPKSEFIMEMELQPDLSQFVKLLRIVHVKKGGKVYSEHQLGGKDMYFVVSGSLFAFYNEETEEPDKPKRVKIGNPLVPGNSFGELTVVCEALPRCHSVVANEPVVIASLDREAFLEFLDYHPTPAINYHKYKCRLMENLFKCFGVHFFDILPNSHFGELGDVIDVCFLQTNEMLTKENDPLTFTYVLSGELLIHSNSNSNSEEEKKVVKVREGQYFGEMGLVVLSNSTVSVAATSPTIVLQVRGDEYASLFKGAMEQYAGLAVQIAQHDTPLPTILFHPMGRSYFTEFMEKIKAEQHVSFFLECSQFHDTIYTSSEHAYPAAKNLVSRFFSPYSKEQINTRAIVRATVLQDVENKNVKANTFMIAFNEVMELLAADYFPEFKELESFAKFLKAVGKNTKSQDGVVVSSNFLLHGKKHDPFVVERDRLKEQTRIRS